MPWNYSNSKGGDGEIGINKLRLRETVSSIIHKKKSMKIHTKKKTEQLGKIYCKPFWGGSKGGSKRGDRGFGGKGTEGILLGVGEVGVTLVTIKYFVLLVWLAPKNEVYFFFFCTSFAQSGVCATPVLSFFLIICVGLV